MGAYGSGDLYGSGALYGDAAPQLSISDLLALDRRHVGYIVVFDGLPLAVTDVGALVGTDWFGDGRTVMGGLGVIDMIMGTDVLEGEPRDERMLLEIMDDEDGTLAGMFPAKSSSSSRLASTIHPYTDLTGTTAVHGKFVGTEAIGTGGERHRYPFIDGISIPQLHLGDDMEHPELAIARVSDVPIVHKGRRVAIYRLLRDWVTHPTNELYGWHSWETVSAAGATERRWIGVMDDGGTVRREKWNVRLSGWREYLEKPLALVGSQAPVRVGVPLVRSNEQGNNKRAIGIALAANVTDAGTFAYDPRPLFGYSLFTEEFSASATTRNEIATEINTLITTVKNDATAPDGAYTAWAPTIGSVVRAPRPGVRMLTGASTAGQVEMKVAAAEHEGTWQVVMYLCMHEDYWRALGYDPPNQRNYEYVAEHGPHKLEHYVPGENLDYTGHTFPPMHAESTNPPGSGYHWGWFTSSEPQVMLLQDGSYDNNGSPRITYPLYPGNVATLPEVLDGGVELTLGLDAFYHPGQLDRPPAPDPDDPSSPYPLSSGGGDVTRQGIFVLTGNRRAAGAEDEEEETQLVVASWRDNDDDVPFSIATDSDGLARIVVTKWLHPQHYSINRERITGGWAMTDAGDEGEGGAVFARPFFRLGYKPQNNPSRIDYVIQRLLLTTGQSTGWTGYEGDPAAALDQTSNEPASFSPVTLDAEIADLGLAIPKELVADVLEWAQVFSALPPGDYLDQWFGFMPGESALDFLRDIFKSLGLAWSFDGGKIGVFDPIASVAPEDAVYTITEAVSRSDEDPTQNITEQDVRVRQPIGRFEISYSINPLERKAEAKLSFPAKAAGARYRGSGDKYAVSFPGQRRYGKDPNGATHSLSGYEKRAAQIARRHEERDFMVRDHRILTEASDSIRVGSPILFTDPQVVAQDGTYGIELHAGRVVRTHESTDGMFGFFTIDAIIEAEPLATFKVCAPLALAYGYDNTNHRILCRDDHAGLGGDWFDVSGFVEPSWSTVGGNLQIQGYNIQRGTVDWTGSVDTVQAAASDSYIELEGAITGTYYRDCDYFVTARPHGDQNASEWPRAIFGVIGFDTGLDGAGNPSTKWAI